MSRRGWLAVATVTVVMLLLGVWFLWPDSEEPPSPPTALPQGTVLLIPGYGGGTGQLEQMSDWLRGEGIRSEIIDVGEGTDDLTTYADAVVERARELVASGQPAPDIIGYSAGGVTARAATSTDPGLFRRVITLASPHQGTGAAVLGQLVNACPPACQQLQPESQLLSSFQTPQRPQDWLSVWSDVDQTIRPPESSEITGINNYRIQDHCPDADLGHGDVPLAAQSKAAIAAFLAGETLPDACVTG